METKFKKIAKFLDALASEEVMDESTESILLVGGTGPVPTSNNGCTNNQCSKDDRLDISCTNNGCTNNRC